MSIPRILRDLEIRLGHTPMQMAELMIDGRWRKLWMKLEWHNPTKSIKDRTAVGLLKQVFAQGQLNPGTTLIESTSGNLGVALAFAAHQLGINFVAVVDPKASKNNIARMQCYGTHIEMVDERDRTGGFLMSRLRRVRSLLDESPGDLVWTDQYSNPAGPMMHYRTTGPEIFEQMNGKVDAVLVAVSTGGSLAGIARYFRQVSPATQIVAVDSVGSVAIGGEPGPRELNGIGSSLPSAFITSGLVDEQIWVSDAQAFAMCQFLRNEADFAVGGSSGALVYAAANYLLARSHIERVVCVLADSGSAYTQTIFDDNWIRDRRKSLDLVRLPVTKAQVN
jgi:N-(2-amino-2-carboxyethyl)-L-glutamate synthase